MADNHQQRKSRSCENREPPVEQHITKIIHPAPRIIEGPLAMLDILGFSDFLNSHPVEQLSHPYDGLLASAYSSRGSHDPHFPRIQIISDTIFAYFLPGDGEPAVLLERLIEYISVLMSNTLVMASHPQSPSPFVLRGALAFGRYHADPDHVFAQQDEETLPGISIVLGKPVVEAYQWEKQQKWVGVSIHPQSQPFIEASCPGLLSRLRHNNRLVLWDVPTAKGLVPSLAVNYVTGNAPDGCDFATPLQQALATLKQTHADVADRYAKYLAAERFVHHIVDNNMHKPYSVCYGND